MQFHHKILLLPNLYVLNDLLNNNSLEDLNLFNCNCYYNCNNIYENKIAIKHWKETNINYIRIWREYSLFGYFFNKNGYEGKNFITALDYIIYDTFIKIDYFYINDNEKFNMYNYPLDIFEAEELVESLIYYLKNIAIQEKKNKIIMSLNNNIKIFEKYFYYNGFNLIESNGIFYKIELDLNINL